MCSTSIRFTAVLPQLEMLPKKNVPHHSQVFSIKGKSYRLRERMTAAATASSPRQNC